MSTQSIVFRKLLLSNSYLTRFITNLSKHIQVSSNSGEKHSFAEVFPKMLWVLRDFSLQLVDDQNKPISSTQYLESALRKVSASATKNEVRSTILQNFPDRDCFVLVRPISDESRSKKVIFNLHRKTSNYRPS